MTSIYVPVGASGYELCRPLTPGAAESLNALVDGSPRRAGWEPVPVEIVRQQRDAYFRRSSSPWFGAHALVFKSTAALVMGGTLRHGELLPLACEERLAVYNPATLENALDENASSLTRCEGGEIVSIASPVFNAREIAHVDSFKVAGVRMSPTFVSGRFVDHWFGSGLRGLGFWKVWSS